MPKTKVLICPYCGETQPEGERCRQCGGMFDKLSRQASHNAMGPWFVRTAGRPFQPGCSYETLVRLIDRGQITKYSVVRGPTTRQFWTVAKRVPGVAHLLGYCHHCGASVDGSDHGCHACGVPFGAYLDRNFLGLPDIRPLPWEADVDDEDRSMMQTTSGRFEQSALPRRAGGLSSFASDEELLARDEMAETDDDEPGDELGEGDSFERSTFSSEVTTTDATPAHPETGAGARADGEKHAAERSETVNDSEYATSATTRAMQRRIESLRRRARGLAVGLVIVILVSIVVHIRDIAALFEPAGDGETPARQSQPDDATDPTSIESERQRSESGGDAQPATQDELDPAAHLSDASVSSRPVAPLALPIAIQEALDLARAAEDSARPLAERIADLERSLQLLSDYRDSGDNAVSSPALAEHVQHIEARLDRLRLEQFFPD